MLDLYSHLFCLASKCSEPHQILDIVDIQTYHLTRSKGKRPVDSRDWQLGLTWMQTL
jgi:hypothetical protein